LHYFREPEENILDPILIQQYERRMVLNPPGGKRGRKPKTSNEKQKSPTTQNASAGWFFIEQNNAIVS
jgi:hypothetical protein